MTYHRASDCRDWVLSDMFCHNIVPQIQIVQKVRYAIYLTLSWQRLYTQAQIGKFS